MRWTGFARCSRTCSPLVLDEAWAVGLFKPDPYIYWCFNSKCAYLWPGAHRNGSVVAKLTHFCCLRCSQTLLDQQTWQACARSFWFQSAQQLCWQVSEGGGPWGLGVMAAARVYVCRTKSMMALTLCRHKEGWQYGLQVHFKSALDPLQTIVAFVSHCLCRLHSPLPPVAFAADTEPSTQQKAVDAPRRILRGKQTPQQRFNQLQLYSAPWHARTIARKPLPFSYLAWR